MSVSGGSVTEATISSLMPSTTYSIQVAAVNSAGIGPYSDTVFVTPDSECIKIIRLNIVGKPCCASFNIYSMLKFLLSYLNHQISVLY